MSEKVLAVPEVHCENCVTSIEGAVGTLKGVEFVKVDLDQKDVTVRFDESRVEVGAIVAAIEDQGYDVGGPKPMQIGHRPDEDSSPSG